jgi:hypothetical protein
MIRKTAINERCENRKATRIAMQAMVPAERKSQRLSGNGIRGLRLIIPPIPQNSKRDPQASIAGEIE